MNKTYKVTTHNTTLCKLNKSRGKNGEYNSIYTNSFCYNRWYIWLDWIQIEQFNKMKSEIEDSRIEWIQQVRSINLNIIKSSYQFIIETDSYIKSEKLLKDIEGKQQSLVKGLIHQKKSRP